MRVLGLISGTSHDGIDAAVVDFAARGRRLHGTVLHSTSVPYSVDLRERLRRALPPAGCDLAEVCALDTLVGQAFAEVAADAVGRVGPVDLVCSHGQTVYHWVRGGAALGTLQIGQPAWIAERLATPVVADVRARDVAAGGHGAPLVSLMDTLLLADLPGNPAALNLGGIANITVPRAPGGPIAYDTGPANALIDAAVTRASGGRDGYDADGRLGAAGRVNPALLAQLLAEPYYALPAPKSTGKELFHDRYLSQALAGHARLSHPDLVTTLTALSAETVADQVRGQGVDTLVAAGGGCANPTLMAMLAARLPGVRIMTTAELGAPPETKEAIAFALIGWHTAHGLPATVATCTGAAGPRVLGAIVPGAGPLRLPDPLSAAPTGLSLAIAAGARR